MIFGVTIRSKKNISFIWSPPRLRPQGAHGEIACLCVVALSKGYKLYIIFVYHPPGPAPVQKTKVRTFSATARDLAMLEAVARYHGLNKSATIASLVRREFWRIFPGGTDRIRPDRGAKVEGEE